MLTIILSNIIVIAIGFLDTFMISGFDVKQIHLSAIGIGSEVWISFESIFISLSIVFGILYSHYNAGKNRKSFLDLFKINMWFSLFFSFLSSMIMYFAADQITGIFINSGGSYSSNELSEIHSIAIAYVQILSIGNIFVSIAIAIFSMFAMIGKIKYNLISSIIAFFINVILNYIFIYVLDMGSKGAGWASTTAYIAQFIFALIVIYWNRNFFREIGSIFKLEKIIFKEILKRWTIFFSNITFMVSLAAQTAIFTKIWSTELIKPLSISYSVSSIIFTVFPAINTSVKIVMGENLGKNQFDYALKESKMLYGITFVLLFILMLIGISVAFTFPTLMLNDSKSIDVSRNVIIIFSTILVVTGSIAFFSSCLESGGIQLWPNIFNYFGQIILMIPITLTLGYTTSLSFSWVFGIAQSANVILLIVLFTMYKRKKWLVNLNDNINKEIKVEM